MPKQLSEIQHLLDAPLDPARVKHREGPGGGNQLSYVEGYDVIDTMNRIFGYDGWSRSEPTLVMLWGRDYVARNGDARHELCYTATTTVTVYWQTETSQAPHSTFQGDGGFGIAVDATGVHIEKAIKEAVTDALKRCARALGNQFGNSLYDKQDPNHAGSQGPARAPATTPSRPQSAAPDSLPSRPTSSPEPMPTRPTTVRPSGEEA